MGRDSCLCLFSYLWRPVAHGFTACVTNCICKLCAALPLTEPILHRCPGLYVIHTMMAVIHSHQTTDGMFTYTAIVLLEVSKWLY